MGLDTLKIDRRRSGLDKRADECLKAFPKNLNISAALELASGKKVDVELYADPEVNRNTHEVIANGKFGGVYIRVRNVTCPDNPATSYLAALSILTPLHNLNEPIVIGT
jgi:aspartate dehydrogenase